jgi:hypothetical protein
MNIWITESATTSESNPSQRHVKTFIINSFSWIDTYIEHGGWFGTSSCFCYFFHSVVHTLFVRCVGGFQSNHTPYDFLSSKNALFNPSSSLTAMAYWCVRLSILSLLRSPSCSFVPILGPAGFSNPINVPMALAPDTTSSQGATRATTTATADLIHYTRQRATITYRS